MRLLQLDECRRKKDKKSIFKKLLISIWGAEATAKQKWQAEMLPLGLFDAVGIFQRSALQLPKQLVGETGKQNATTLESASPVPIIETHHPHRPLSIKLFWPRINEAATRL